jgi:hypothetical protein
MNMHDVLNSVMLRKIIRLWANARTKNFKGPSHTSHMTKVQIIQSPIPGLTKLPPKMLQLLSFECRCAFCFTKYGMVL